MLKYSIYILVCSCIYFSSFAQEEIDTLDDEVNVDDLGNVSDEFQENFFKAITQRAIYNHERANQLLRELIAEKPDEGVLYVEQDKNYFALEQYEQSEKAFLEALTKLPEEAHFDTKVSLLLVYQAQQNYQKGLALANELAKIQISYLEVSANILSVQRQPKKALDVLDDLEKKQGFTETTERLRELIYLDYELYKQAISYYQSKVKTDPKNILWYAKLMRFYSQNNQLKKTIETGLEALEINPFQPDILAMLSLAYLNENNIEAAITYVEKSLEHNEVNERNKVLIIQSLKRFVDDNPEYQVELIRILDKAIESGESQASNEERGLFLLSQNKKKALESFLLALKDQPGKLPLIKQVASLQLELGQYKQAIVVINEALEIYPMQSELFLLKGKAEAGNQSYEKAIYTLEEGLEYLFDLPELENEFYKTLIKIYEATGDDAKAKEYKKKVK